MTINIDGLRMHSSVGGVAPGLHLTMHDPARAL